MHETLILQRFWCHQRTFPPWLLMGQAMSTAAPTATPSGSRVGRLSVFSRAEGGVLGVQAAGPLLLGHQQGVGPSPSVSQGAAVAATVRTQTHSLQGLGPSRLIGSQSNQCGGRRQWRAAKPSPRQPPSSPWPSPSSPSPPPSPLSPASPQSRPPGWWRRARLLCPPARSPSQGRQC